MSSTPGGVMLQSPLSSPGKLSRQQEKEQLSELNGRLAMFMDRVKTLRLANEQLRKELDDVKAAAARELADARRMYDQEVADLRRVLDDTAREKAKNQIHATKNEVLANELKAKLKAETDALVDVQRQLRALQQEVAKKDGELQASLRDSHALRRANKDAEKEAADARKHADSAQGKLDAETVARVDAENNLQSMKEDMEFKQQMAEKERQDVYAKLAAKERELAATVAEFQARLDEQHSKELDDLREQFDLDLTAQRQELERVADEKYRQVADRADREKALAKSLMDENRKVRDNAQGLKDANTVLEAKNGELQKRLDHMDQDRQAERAQNDKRRRELEDDLAAAREENDGYRRAYDDLLDVQTRVDNEIQTYSALMEMEMPKGQKRGRKRRANAAEPEDQAMVVIREVSADGLFIRLTNTGGEDISLGHWKVVCGDKTHKFGPRFVLKARSTITLWATDSGRQHRPPRDIAVKSCKLWPVADPLACALLNGAGEVHYEFQGRTSRDEAEGGGQQHEGVSQSEEQQSLPKEDLFHIRGDPPKTPEGGCTVC